MPDPVMPAAELRHEVVEPPFNLLPVGPELDILVRPSQVTRLAKLIPGAKYERIDGAGHGVIQQCPQQVNDRLLSHFADADRAST